MSVAVISVLSRFRTVAISYDPADLGATPNSCAGLL
jgi:hypothetical protein